MLLTDETIEQIKLVCRQQIQAMIFKDLDLLNKIISDDAVLVHITGELQTKAEWLNAINKGRMKYFSNKEISLKVSFNQNQPRVIMRNRLEARIYGFRDTWNLETQIDLNNYSGQWQIVQSKVGMF